MGVDFIVNGAGGAQAVTRVQDAFGRGTLNPAAGPFSWFPVSQIISPVSTPTNIIDVFCDGTGNLVFSSFGGNNPTTIYPCYMPCQAFTFSAVSGQSQHAQVVFNGLANAGVGGDAGPSVFTTTNGQAGASAYFCLIDNASKITVCRSGVASNVLFQVNLSGAQFATAAPGDVLRLSVLAGSPNTITLQQNGSTIFTGTDNNLNAGVPGMASEQILVSGGVSLQVKFQSFDGGLGV